MPEPLDPPSQSIPIKKKRSRKKIIFLLNLVLIIAVVALGYGYYVKKKELDTIKDPTAQAEVARKAAIEVANQARKIVLIPESDEVPEVLTINNPELAVKEQPNLAGVIAGDKILLYIKSGKAIVYSPSRNIIVNILPVTLQQKQDQAGSRQNANTRTNTGTSTSNR